MRALPSETAGFAKEVDEVKKYAEAIHSEINEARFLTLNFLQLAIAISTKPKLATTSETNMFEPKRSTCEMLKIE